MKPLFIPLKTEYYRAFESGDKTREYRPFGPRWNERTCVVGRQVTLSRGYSTPDRLSGRVAGFRRIAPAELQGLARVAWSFIYPGQTDIAEIEIALSAPDKG